MSRITPTHRLHIIANTTPAATQNSRRNANADRRDILVRIGFILSPAADASFASAVPAFEFAQSVFDGSGRALR
jgi:hypothetical protein